MDADGQRLKLWARRRPFRLILCENGVMAAVQVQHYLGWARDFREGMMRLREEEVFVFDNRLIPYRYSPALLAVHCAMSYANAICVGLGSTDVSYKDHRLAAEDMETRLKNYRGKLGDLAKQGPDQARRILGHKNEIAYATSELRPEFVSEIVQRAIRFSLWAENIGRKLNIAGW